MENLNNYDVKKLTFCFHPKPLNLRLDVSLAHLFARSGWHHLVLCDAKKVLMHGIIVVAWDTSSSTWRWVATIEPRCRGFLAINAVMNRVQLIRCLVMCRTRNVFRWWIRNGNFDFFMFSRAKAGKAFGWGTSKARRGAIRTTIITVWWVVIIRTTTAMYSQCQSLLLESTSNSFGAFFHHL